MDNVLSMRITEGSAGYGVYMMLLELLRDADNQTLKANARHLAFAINEPDVDLVDRVLHDYDLFTLQEDDTFTSPWLRTAMQAYETAKTAASEAGKRGAAKRWGKPSTEQQQVTSSSQSSTNPNSNPMGGGMATLSSPNGNQSIIVNQENKPINSRSKLLGLSWGDWSGEELYSLSRKPSELITDEVVGMYVDMSDNEHNLGYVAQCCRTMGVTQDVMLLLLDWTHRALVGSEEIKRLIRLSKYLQTGEFKPKYPNEYVLYRLLSNDQIA